MKSFKSKTVFGTSSKTLLMINRSDTLAEQVDCNVWEGECAAGADSSMQRWSRQVSGWLILASEVGAGSEQVWFSLKLGAKYQGRDPDHMLVRPGGTVNQRRGGGWRRNSFMFPRPKVQTSSFLHLSAWRQKPLFLFCLFISLPLMHVYIPYMFNILFSST